MSRFRFFGPQNPKNIWFHWSWLGWLVVSCFSWLGCPSLPLVPPPPALSCESQGDCGTGLCLAGICVVSNRPRGDGKPRPNAEDSALVESTIDGVKEPNSEQSEPATQADEPATQADEPATQADEPATQADEPATQTDEPPTQDAGEPFGELTPREQANPEVLSEGEFIQEQGCQPTTKACDGKDNDCNGTIDEDPSCCKLGQTQACYSGRNPSLAGVGECKKGTQQCMNLTWGPCTGETLPSIETCDGKDDDCNGKIDDLSPSSCAPASVPSYYSCKRGLSTCVSGTPTCVIQSTRTLTVRDNVSEGKIQPCAQAEFNEPGGLLLAPNGDLFVSDFSNHTIRKISPTGVVTLIAGTGSPGHKDGPGKGAMFYKPRGMAMDATGNLYVADLTNHVIRLITFVSNGSCGSQANYTGYCVETLAGEVRHSGFADGSATTARFNDPFGLAIDSKGFIYVTDSLNHQIRRIERHKAGVSVTTIAGTGHPGVVDGVGTNASSGTKSSFYRPSGIVVDKKDHIYVVDAQTSNLRKIEAMTSGSCGGTTGYTGYCTSTLAKGPSLQISVIGMDSQGSFYAASSVRHQIHKIDSNGKVTIVSGIQWQSGYINGSRKLSKFNSPSAIAVDSQKRIFVADSLNHVIRVIDQEGVKTYAGRGQGKYRSIADGEALCAGVDTPTDVVKDSLGNIYIADAEGHVILRLTPKGYLEVYAGTVGVSGNTNGTLREALFNAPTGLAFDTKGDLYVADRENHCIRRISTLGKVDTFTGKCGSLGSKDGKKKDVRFYKPQGLAFDSSGNLYVADTSNHRIRKIDGKGDASTYAGKVRGSKPGTGVGASFCSPTKLMVDGKDDVYVSDSGNHCIRKIDPWQNVNSFAGQCGLLGNTDGARLSAKFRQPQMLLSASQTGFFVADMDNHRVRLVDTSKNPAVSTIVGRFRGNKNGPALDAKFDQISGMIIDLNGDMLVLDKGNHKLRLVPACPP